MTKRFKFLVFILCICSLVSLCVMPSFADETTEINSETTSPAEETTVQDETQADPSETGAWERPGNAPLAVEFTALGKSEYTEGELFDPAGFTVKVKYEHNDREMPLSDAVCTHEGPLTAGMTMLGFTFDGFAFELPITVAPASKTVTGIQVTSTKTDYLALDLIDTSALAAVILYSDGTQEPLDLSLCSVYPALDTPLSASVTAILVDYKLGEGDAAISHSASFEVKVAPILSIEIEGLDGAWVYEAQPLTKPASLTVTAYYDAEQTISKAITSYDLTSDTEFVIPDSNGEFSATVTADTVSENIKLPVQIIAGYEVTGFKPVYYYGDAFTKDGITVKALYGDYSKYDVTEQVIFDVPETIVADSRIHLSHNGYDLKDFLNTSLPAGTIIIIAEPNKTKYEIGETFDPSGLEIAVEYTDGEKRFLNPGDYSLIVSDPLTAADKVVRVSYYGITESFEIKVGNEAYIAYLTLLTAPERLNYFEGGLLDITGLVIEAQLSDGTKIKIDPNILTFTPSLDTPLSLDTTSIVISANDGTDKYCSVSLPVIVDKKVPQHLLPTSMPNKLTYKEGEVFDPDGLLLSVIFNDGSVIDPSSYSFVPELGTAFILRGNNTEKIIIYVVYQADDVELTYPIEVTVTPEEVERLMISRDPDKIVYDIGDTFDPTGIELLVIYKDRNVLPQSVPADYFSCNTTLITASTTEIVFEYRGLKVALPITVNGVTTTEETTDPIVPPVTAEVTTEETTAETTAESTTEITTEGTTEEETPGVIDQTTSPDTGDETTDVGDNTGKTNVLLYLWIAIIAIIIIALIILIIYYKRNFT